MQNYVIALIVFEKAFQYIALQQYGYKNKTAIVCTEKSIFPLVIVNTGEYGEFASKQGKGEALGVGGVGCCRLSFPNILQTWQAQGSIQLGLSLQMLPINYLLLIHFAQLLLSALL